MYRNIIDKNINIAVGHYWNNLIYEGDCELTTFKTHIIT